jgi:flagellar basal-body rod protein FlgG
MAITAMYASASGMRALDTKLSVLANNLANINTTGFKRSRANFEDLFYQTRIEPGAQSAGGDDPTPAGLQVGLGAMASNTQLNLTQGSIDATGQTYDLAIEGNGFFQVNTTVGGQEVIAYTRAGNFIVNANGNLVLGNSIGSVLDPAISIGQDVQEVVVGSSGQVSARVQGQSAFTQIGQITLARFINPTGLVSVGKNLYMATDASGEAIVANPTENGLGMIQQGSLELSNVDPVRELVELIQTQRYYELNSQAVKAADDTMQLISSLKR